MLHPADAVVVTFRGGPVTAAPTQGRSPELTTWISRAPRARAATTAPSSTRCGATSSSALSLALAGSPSAALTTT